MGLMMQTDEENQEADNLTNEAFNGFDANRRVALVFGDLPLDLFLSLQNACADFDQKRKDFKMVNPVKKEDQTYREDCLVIS